MENIFSIWEETAENRLTQLVFCDASTPSGKGFNIYDDIRDKLIAKGIPKDEIAFIHDCNTDQQKAALFAKVRSGKVRVLMGSTQKMGAGTNVQDKLIAIHDVDCPWRPSDLEQRAGRIVRQGNNNPEVRIFRYVTDSTFDAYLFQTIENKQKFISQIMTSKSPVRTCDDVDEAALSYAEIKALCAGNPLIVEKIQLDIEVARLKVLRGDYQSDIYRLQDNITQNFPKQIKKVEATIASYKADIALAAANTHKDKEGISPLKIGGKVYTERAEAGEAILLARKGMTGTGVETIGSYRGFEIQVSYDTRANEHKLHLKGNQTYTMSMGDSMGNIARLDNAIDKLGDSLKDVETRLDNLLEQMVAAKEAVDKPFPQEAEYQEKVAKLAELDAALNTDDRVVEPTQHEPDEKDENDLGDGEIGDDEIDNDEIEEDDVFEGEEIEDGEEVADSGGIAETAGAVQNRPVAAVNLGVSATAPKAANNPPQKIVGIRDTTALNSQVNAIFDRLSEGSRGNIAPLKPASPERNDPANPIRPNHADVAI
jgi:hypothetical protein